jgi:rod shape-determining protein MreC
MSRARERYRNQKYIHLALAILLLSQLVLMAVSARTVGTTGDEQSLFRTWVMTLVTPVESLFTGATSGIGSIWTGYVDLRGVRDRNTTLEAENAAMRAEIEQARLAAAENARLREMLDIGPLLKYDTVVAQVVARDTTAWFKRVVVNKGTRAGIKLDHPVITPNGLVGRVVAVGPNFAQIQLITDEHAGVGGRLVTARAAGEVKGRGDGFCRFKSITGLVDVAQGEAILTSGLDRIYPAGILVGYVESATPGSGAAPIDIVVRPAADLDRLSELMVLKVEPSDIQLPETIK